MNLQGRNLCRETSGDDVKLLQRELTQLGLLIPDDELQQPAFGKGTREAVLRVRETERAAGNGWGIHAAVREVNKWPMC